MSSIKQLPASFPLKRDSRDDPKVFLQRGGFVRRVKRPPGALTLTAAVPLCLPYPHTSFKEIQNHSRTLLTWAWPHLHGASREVLWESFGLSSMSPWHTAGLLRAKEGQAYARSQHGVPARRFPPQPPAPGHNSFPVALTVTVKDSSFALASLSSYVQLRWKTAMSQPQHHPLPDLKHLWTISELNGS